MEIIKVENEVDVPSEEDYTGMNSDDLYTQPTVSIENAEPGVSLILI
jgi:hypothetical protein